MQMLSIVDRAERAAAEQQLLFLREQTFVRSLRRLSLDLHSLALDDDS